MRGGAGIKKGDIVKLISENTRDLVLISGDAKQSPSSNCTYLVTNIRRKFPNLLTKYLEMVSELNYPIGDDSTPCYEVLEDKVALAVPSPSNRKWEGKPTWWDKPEYDI